MTETRGRAVAQQTATLQARVFGYLVDSVVLAGLLLVFFAIGGFVFLAGSDFGDNREPADAYWFAVVSIPFLAIPFWTALNLALLQWRRQTVGQYISGVEVVREDGRKASLGEYSKMWFALNPLFFHPLLTIPLAALVAVGSYETVGAAGSWTDSIVWLVAVAVGILCLLAPILALAAIGLSRERRSMYERLSGTRMIAVEDE